MQVFLLCSNVANWAVGSLCVLAQKKDLSRSISFAGECNALAFCFPVDEFSLSSGTKVNTLGAARIRNPITACAFGSDNKSVLATGDNFLMRWEYVPPQET